MAGLQLVNVHKSFGNTVALKEVSLEVAQGELVAILGPSGSGKSTLLMVSAGLETPDSGDVRWDGRSLLAVPSHQRGFGLMFQDFVLFPHMNVFDNVAFGLRMAEVEQSEISRRVSQALALVGMDGFEKRDVNTLSGGEQQRVALARSLVPEPRLLMLDEPLGSLDRNLRERLVGELREILQSLRQTAIYVTHDQQEAFTLADQVIIMNAGQIEQSGTPQDIYRRPDSLFVARFLGLDNIFPGEIRFVEGNPTADTPIGQFPVNTGLQGPVKLLFRPDSVRIDGAGSHTIEGLILERSFRGSLHRAVVEVNGLRLKFDFLASTILPDEGQKLQLSFDPQTAIQVLQ